MKNSIKTSYIIKKNLGIFVGYLVKGCIITLPAAITLYLVFILVTKIDGVITDNSFIAQHITKVPSGTGFLIIIFGLTLIGFLGGSYLLSPIKSLFLKFVNKTPGIKLLYNGIKDFLEAIVGEKKKFNNPVIIKVNENPEIWQFGFITQQSLDFIQMPNYVSVYCPKAYGILGDLLIIKSENIKLIDGMNSSEMLKFVISGGVISDNEIDAEK